TILGKLSIPDLHPGSSNMSDTVKPVIVEPASMVCAQVMGNDTTIPFTKTKRAFVLNVEITAVASNLLESIRLLANSSRVMAEKKIDGLQANVERAAFLASASPSIVTPLNKIIGYEQAAEIAKHAVAEKITVREATIDLGYVER